MIKGNFTVKDIIEGFDWTDVDFIIYKCHIIYFHDDESADVEYEEVFNSTKPNNEFSDIEKYYSMKIQSIDGAMSNDGKAILELNENFQQYEEKAKQNPDWVYQEKS